jgi:hypothetical protein
MVRLNRVVYSYHPPMNNFIPRLICLLSLAVAAVPPANAWGPLGHKAVALVAQERLTPTARRAVYDLIGGVGLDKISNCADSMLFAKDVYNCAGAFDVQADPKKKTQPWHYISLPITVSHSRSTLMDYCPNGKDCVVEQVRRQATTLGNPKASREQKQIALMYLVHITGDEHQPLHNAEDNDIGGNRKQTTFMGVKKNLHSLWDDLIMPEDWKEQDKMDPSPLADELQRLIAAGDLGSAGSGDFIIDAALESHAIAKTKIHAQYSKDKGRNLGLPYQQQMQPTVKLRLAKAGVRLAVLINQALDRGDMLQGNDADSDSISYSEPGGLQ